MPTYEYACDGCGTEFEREQRITEEPIRKCPKCGKLKVRRMITQGNFILKGGGWYADLYSSSGSSTKTKSDPAPAESTSAASSTESGGDKAASTEKKPTKKAKAKPA